MGDRALIVVTNTSRDEVSPTVYLHWGGSDVPTLLGQLKALMAGREGDVSYAAARLVGLAHQCSPGNMSLGMWDTGRETAALVRSGDPETLAQESHGDAGFIVVNCDDFTWQAYGGYLARHSVDA